MKEEPNGELTIRVLAMPKDTNPSGDIFGGWLLSQMDIAGGIFCARTTKSRVVTIAMNAITLKSPVFIGDTVCCYVQLIKIGRTSIKVHIEAWVDGTHVNYEKIKVTQGDFTYVKVDKNRKPTKIVLS